MCIFGIEEDDEHVLVMFLSRLVLNCKFRNCLWENVGLCYVGYLWYCVAIFGAKRGIGFVLVSC